MAVLLLHRSSTVPHPRQDARVNDCARAACGTWYRLKSGRVPAKWRLSLTRRALVCFTQSIRRNIAWRLHVFLKNKCAQMTTPG
eukprot:gene15467-biopygen6680